VSTGPKRERPNRRLGARCNDRERWRRFLFLVFLALAITVGWWMLVGGGIHVLMHDFSPASIPPHTVAVRLDFYR
jgi:hypothetical protein